MVETAKFLLETTLSATEKFKRSQMRFLTKVRKGAMKILRSSNQVKNPVRKILKVTLKVFSQNQKARKYCKSALTTLQIAISDYQLENIPKEL